jgi:hypothetical protein
MCKAKVSLPAVWGISILRLSVLTVYFFHIIDTVDRDTPPYGHAPTYQISLIYLERQKSYGPDKLRWEEAEEEEAKAKNQTKTICLPSFKGKCISWKTHIWVWLIHQKVCMYNFSYILNGIYKISFKKDESMWG